MTGTDLQCLPQMGDLGICVLSGMTAGAACFLQAVALPLSIRLSSISGDLFTQPTGLTGKSRRAKNSCWRLTDQEIGEGIGDP